MITARLLRSSLHRYAVPLLLTLLILAALALGETARTWLAYDRAALQHGELWRLLTHPLVHLGSYHALLNLLGLAALLMLCPRILRAGEWLRRLCVLALCVSLGLYLAVPQVDRFVGLSGVLHGLFLLGLVPMMRERDLLASAALLYLLGKLAWEFAAGAPLSDAQAIGGRVVTESHLLGTLAGLAYGLAFGSFHSSSGSSNR